MATRKRRLGWRKAKLADEEDEMLRCCVRWPQRLRDFPTCIQQRLRTRLIHALRVRVGHQLYADNLYTFQAFIWGSGRSLE